MKHNKSKDADRDRDFEGYGLMVDIRSEKAEQMCTCPECSEHRSLKNKKKKCCSVNVDYGVWHCHHCNASGYVPSKKELEERSAREKRIDAKRDSLPLQGKFCRPKYQPSFSINNILVIPRSTFRKENGDDRIPTDDELINLLTNKEQQTVLNYLTKERKFTLHALGVSPICIPPTPLQPQKEMLTPSETKGRTPPLGAGGLTLPIQGEKEGVFTPPTETKGLIRFLYFDHGILINQKTRKLDKAFWMHKGAEVIPYNIDAIMRKSVCYITEGEFDVISLIQAGYPESISVPTGGSNTNLEWLDRFAETLFDDKEEIFLCTDNDKVGYGMMKELVRRLGGYRCKIVLWDNDCKDANEELQKHGVDGIRRCISKARPVPDYGMETAKTPHVERELDELFTNGMGTGAPIGIENVDKLITYETGRYMIVSGRPGDGKSEFVDEICLRLAIRNGWKTAYFSPENFPLKYHLAKLVSKLTGYKFQSGGSLTQELYERCKEWLSQNMCHIMPGGEDNDDSIADFSDKVDIRKLLTSDIANEETFTLNQVLAVAREAVVRRGVRILVLDPLNSIMRDEEDKGLTPLDWDLEVCNKLLAFAHTNDVLVILVAHPRKVDRATMTNAKRRVEMNDINGSSKFGAKCDYCLIIDRDDDLQVVNAYVDKVKFKHLGTRGSTTLFYDITSGRYVPCELRRLTPNEQRMYEQNGAPKGAEVLEKENTKWIKTIDWRWFNVRWI